MLSEQDITLPPYVSLIQNYYPKSITRINLRETLSDVFNEVYDNMRHFYVSNDDYHFDADENPFFLPPPSSLLTENYPESMTKFREQKERLPSDVVLNPWITTLQFIAGNTRKALSTETGWIIFSFHQMVDRILGYRERNPGITWTDIGHVSRGLGHVLVLRMDTRNGQLFMQPDGGSNGWDRQYHWDLYKDQKLNDDNYISYSVFLEEISKKKH